MAEERSHLKVFLAATFIIVSGLVAVRVLLSSRGSAGGSRPATAPQEPAPAPPDRTSVFDDTRNAQRIGAELASRELGYAKTETTLPDLKLPEGPAYDPAVDKALSPHPPSEKKRYEEPAASVPQLTEQEKALLESAGGPRTPEEAAKLGGSFDLMARLMVRLGRSPRLAGYIFNNDWVVKGYMSRSTTRGTCSDPGKLKNFFMDTSDPKGISRSLPIVMQIAHGSREMPSVMATSKLVTEFLECPSFKGLLNDPASVKEVAIANPAIFTSMAEPDVIEAIMKSPTAFGAFKKAQAGRQ